MRKMRLGTASVPVLLLSLALGACDDDPSGAEGPARVDVFLTDAPGDVAGAWVDVESIYLQGPGDGAEDGEEEGAEAPSGRADLVTEPTGLIELTALAGTTEELAADVEVPAGSWAQLRFVIAGAVLETEGGDVFTFGGAEHPDGLASTGSLLCPSCTQSGLKVIFPGGGLVLDAEEDAGLVLDFDVTQSFGRQAGQSGMWVMRPVIVADRLEDVGSIEGSVALATDADGIPTVEIPECPAGTPRGLADFVPTATAATLVDADGNPVVASGETDEEGSFVIGPVSPDTWTLGFEAELELEGAALLFDADVTPAEITVAESESVGGVEYTITEATCDAGGGT